MAAAEQEVKPQPFNRPLPKPKAALADFKLADFNRSCWCISLKVGQSREDFMRPDFWAHVASRMKKHDRVEILHEEGGYFAEVIVKSVEKLGVIVALLREVNLNELETTTVDQSEYTLKFRGPRKWSILRTADGQVIEENIDTEGQAKQKLVDMTKSAAA